MDIVGKYEDHKNGSSGFVSFLWWNSKVKTAMACARNGILHIAARCIFTSM